MLSAVLRLRRRAAACLLAGLGLTGAALGQGRFVAPQPGQALTAGATVAVRWLAPCVGANDGKSETELVLSLDGGVTFRIRVTPEMQACSGGFQWRVPALRTSHARLALRTGSGEESQSERLELVSAEFEIVAAEDEVPEDLVRGRREWWTRQALEGNGVEDLPSASMVDAAEKLVTPVVSVDANEPPSPGLSTPRLSAAPLAERSREPKAGPVASIDENPVRALPLRL